MTSIPNNIFVYEVQQDGAIAYYRSPLPIDFGFKRGLSPQSIMGQFHNGVDKLTPDNFARNPLFVDFLHRVIEKYGPNCPGILAEAKRIGNGTVAVIDLRVPDLTAAIAPEDIVGLFSVTDNVIAKYHPCPKHRVINEFGIMRFPEWLHDKLVAELKAEA